jgi:2-C-methyl-D-erythritol 4-phosphate cytidylyltransferase
MTSIKSAAILVAAGQGQRLAGSTGGIPKQFTRLSETPLFIWSLTTLVKHALIEHVLVAVPEDWQHKTGELIAEFLPEFKNKIAIIAGGSTRQQSVYLALEKLDKSEMRPTYVFVHDAVRPFITSYILDQILKKLEEGHTVTLGIALSDSIKEVDRNIVLEDLDRNKFILVQTPQAAKFNLMLEAHRSAKLQQKQNTDDASVMKAYGTVVTVVTGSKLNFKITDHDDLLLAQALIKHHDWSVGNVYYNSSNNLSAFSTKMTK